MARCQTARLRIRRRASPWPVATSSGPRSGEASYRRQAVATGRYRSRKFLRPRSKRGRIVTSGTSWPPVRTRRRTLAIAKSTLGNPQEDDVHLVTGFAPASQSPCQRHARQRRLACKASLSASQLIQTPKHDSPGVDRRAFGSKGAQPQRERVRIHEFVNPQRPSQQTRRSRGLASAIGAAQDDHTRSPWLHDHGVVLASIGDRSLVQLRRHVQAGLDQIEGGEYTAYDRTSTPRLAARVKARGKKRRSCASLLIDTNLPLAKGRNRRQRRIVAIVMQHREVVAQRAPQSGSALDRTVRPF